MHFIEQFFGFSPDGGSGLTELLFLLTPLLGLLLALVWRYRRAKLREPSFSSHPRF